MSTTTQQVRSKFLKRVSINTKSIMRTAQQVFMDEVNEIFTRFQKVLIVKKAKTIEEAVISLFNVSNQLVFKSNTRRIHRLVVFSVLRARSDILMELLMFDIAIKSYKSVKNFTKRWQRSNDLSLYTGD